MVVVSVAAWRRCSLSSGGWEVLTETGDASLKSGVRAVRVAGVRVASIHSGGGEAQHRSRAAAAAVRTCAGQVVHQVQQARELATAASEDMKSTMAKGLASSAKAKGTAPETLSERVVVCAGTQVEAGGKTPKTAASWKPDAGKCWTCSSGSTAGTGRPRKTTTDRDRREQQTTSRRQRYWSRPGAGAGAAAAGEIAAGAHAVAVGSGDEMSPYPLPAGGVAASCWQRRRAATWGGEGAGRRGATVDSSGRLALRCFGVVVAKRLTGGRAGGRERERERR